jgi:glutaredoxin 3
MAVVTVYTGFACSFCQRAKMLLTHKGVEFTEINVAQDPDQRPIMMERASGARTVPQIFIDDLHVGGCDDLYALDRTGNLDGLLGLEANPN